MRPFLFFILLSARTFASLNEDSLLNVAGKAANDGSRIEAFLGLSAIYKNKDSAKALEYAGEARIISEKIKSNDEKSYTRKLIANPNELKRKIIEEAGEVVTADSKENLIWECSDLIYFLFVIMAREGITIKDIERENERRNKETLINNQVLLNQKEKT